MVKHTAGRPPSQVNNRVVTATYALVAAQAHARADAAAGGGAGVDIPATSRVSGPGTANSPLNNIAAGPQNETIPPGRDCQAGNIPHDVESTIRADIELSRIAMALHLSALLRLWLICLQIIRDTNNQGVSRLQLNSALTRYGVQDCPAYITRLLHSEDGRRFWRIDARGTLFPIGYIALCRALVQLAADSGLPHLYDHAPGTRKPMYLDVSGSMKDFEAHLVAAWYECHNDPTVSRFLLERWFNRTDVTLRKLECRARVEKTYNTAETLEPSAVPVNADGELRFHRRRKNKRGQTVYSFQLPNTYHVKGVRQHAHRGQGYKAAAVIRQLTDQLTGLCDAGNGDVPGEDNRRGRLYYADYKRVRQARRKGREGVLYSPARPGGVRHTVWDVWV